MADERYLIRRVRLDEAVVICRHRRLMFEEIGITDQSKLDVMAEQFAPWVEQRLQTEEYVGWFAVTPAGEIAAGAGLWFVPWPPIVVDPDGPRGYILNVYTEPAHRRQGLARQLTLRCIDHCRELRLKVVTLHASQFGRSLYESLGFALTNEMRLELA